MEILNRIKKLCFVTLRVKKYQWLSDCKNVSGKPDLYLPLLLKGKGKIGFGKNFQSGVIASACFYTNYNYILTIDEESEVLIGNDVVFSNGVSIYAKTKVTIGDKTMIGINCFIIDNDGHDLSAEGRMSGTPKSAAITIGKNVAIYYNSIILKGVTIGENSVIGSGSIVTRDIPANVFAAGNPAKVIRNL